MIQNPAWSNVLPEVLIFLEASEWVGRSREGKRISSKDQNLTKTWSVPLSS